MWTNIKFRLAIIVLVVACLLIPQLQPTAFAQQTATQTPATAPAQDPAPRKKRSKLKWILIGAAAAGAVVAAVLVTRQKSEPVVTVGGPSVGNPQ
jgi:hypothetical protein